MNIKKAKELRKKLKYKPSEERDYQLVSGTRVLADCWRKTYQEAKKELKRKVG